MNVEPNFDFLKDCVDSNPYPLSASEYVRYQKKSDALEKRRTLMVIGLSMGLAGLISALAFCCSAENIDSPSQPSQLESQLQSYQ